MSEHLTLLYCKLIILRYQHEMGNNLSSATNVKRFRTVHGNLTRKFKDSDKVSTILCYLQSNGFNSKENRVLSDWPRHDVRFLWPINVNNLNIYR